MSGGEALAKSLVSEGVEVVFGIPGIQVYGIVAALRDEPGIRMITTRHEQAATHMADGYARASGQPGVALVVPGVGLYNASSGLATAYSRSTPVLLVAGQVPRPAIGKNIGAVHEVADQAGTVRSVTKWQRQASRPREVPDAVFEAFRQMRTGRPRPVLIEMPPEAGVEREEVELRNPARATRIVPSPEDLREAARVISRSSMPLIYAGGGVARSDAEDALVKLAEATNTAVITSSGGKGTIPDSHPLSYGSCFSPRGERQEMNQLYEVMQSADVVIGIGARFSLGNPAGEASTLVNINIDHAELTRHQANTIPLHGDARATIEVLLPYLIEAGAEERPSPAEAVSAARKLIAYYDIRLKEPQYAVLEAMQRGIPQDAFIVWDVTQFGYYARTHYQVNHPKTYIDSGYSFNLGYAYPTALGVKVARPDRPVICMAGDGGFMFNSPELSTALKYGINVVAVIFRNDSYGNVARDLDDAFGGAYGTDLHNPDFVRYAESFGAVGMRADDPMELERLIPLALERQSPVLIEVPFGEMSIPPAPQFAPLYKLPWTMPQEGLIQS
ncbi:MAG: thiamine pyrophosphate-binding protein [Acidimicrobiaceae bacterium]|nr:thiamine pyrophosphate-binding protein [Acidimicrobiaceae bacterium]MDE0514794.1 thiamine pyrophosphate-binding protein [Acidimicrobiaceae bacterium]MDE0655744.1 thiamine pyrophosphate-binding protein [Acidimicrobiaceae bacterium]MXZ96497.1 thiamine pyrophosphate-binding protein [Acidimicrobiaceae bacterium]MYF41854.1 thiamine pyrophosphate-binding protein [Acidimicrobiaceae bacterium]